MSPTGALIVALSAILILVAVAAWLVNLPLWLIGGLLLGGGFALRKLFRRLSQSRVREGRET